MAKYIYICSAGHSGSTLLDLLLGSHSSIASLGEIDQLSKNLALNTLCTCGERVRSCSVWRAIVQHTGERLNLDIMTAPYSLHLGYPKATTIVDRKHQTTLYLARRRMILGLYYLYARYPLRLLQPLEWPMQQAAGNNLALFDSARGVLAADLVVDSSKSYLKAIALYRRDPDNVRILLLARDGRGVYWSNRKRGTPRRRAVGNWRNQYARALPLLRKHVLSEHLLSVRYESIVENTAGELKRICEFLGQPFEECMLDYRSKTHHLANGNDMRFQKSSQLQADVEWQRQLTRADLEYFERHAGRLNRELGYV